MTDIPRIAVLELERRLQEIERRLDLLERVRLPQPPADPRERTHG